MIDSNETVRLVCKTATVNEKSGDHKSALFKLVLYNKKLHPKGDKGEKSSFIRKLFCLLVLLNISKDWTKSETEERGEAPKLFRRRSAHRSLSQCKVKARVEITVKTSRTQSTSCGQPRWGCAGCRGKFERRREQKMLLRSESDRNGGWAHYALFLREIKISMQGVRTWAAWAKRIFLSGAQWSHHCGILFPGKHAVLARLNKPFLFKPLVLSLLFMLETNNKVHKLSLTPVFSSHVVPTFNHGHAVCKCDLTETHRAEHNLRGPWTKGLAGNLGLVSISNVQSCSFNSTGNTKLSHIIVIKS